MAETLPRVLCVDDEPYLLSALQRILSDRFQLVTAESGEAGLELVRQGGPFEVIVSDMRMPHMDGATFLARVRAIAPDAVRILLTGHADVDSAAAAINQGAIFRYLQKPCPREVLRQTLDEAVLEHRLLHAERELLATTLAGAVKTITDVLQLAAPGAFQRGKVAQTCVRHALQRLGWSDAWKYEVAASLSQLGSLALQQENTEGDDGPLSDGAARANAETGYRLLAGIPRLQEVAEMVRYQTAPAPATVSADVARGAQLLRAALKLEQLVARGISPGNVLPALLDLRPAIAEDVVRALADFRGDFSEIRTAHIRDLAAGWVLDDEIRTHSGVLVMSKGQEITEAAILALRRLYFAHAIADRVRVRYQPVKNG